MGAHTIPPENPKEVCPTAYDPVCSIEVDEGSALWVSEFRGKRYYFCAPRCKGLFDTDPRLFIRDDLDDGVSTFLDGRIHITKVRGGQHQG